jgi:hypothetical protein
MATWSAQFWPPPRRLYLQLPPPQLTCEFLLSKGLNLQDEGKWCKDLKTEAECGELNYVPASGGVFKQCGFKSGSCSTKHGHLVCPA